MDYKVVISPRAIQDLSQIVRYISFDDPKAAERFGYALVDQALSLSFAKPDCGRDVFQVGLGNMDAATIEREALTLTVAERAILADRLLQTLDIEGAERMEQWGLEADRRLQAFERREMRSTPGPAAVAAIRRRLE